MLFVKEKGAPKGPLMETLPNGYMGTISVIMRRANRPKATHMTG